MDNILNTYFYPLAATLTGLGVFLFGVRHLSNALKQFSSGRLENTLAKFSQKKIYGVGLGAGVTALFHSSTITTVTVITFVDAGILTLNSGAAIIMGANIGTTVTGLMTAVGVMEFSVLFGVCTLVGTIILMVSTAQSTKNLGNCVVGFGLLFAGINLLTKGISVVADYPFIKSFMTAATNPMLLLLFGALSSALMQSSSAITAILISLAASGAAMQGNGVAFVLLGVDIGTCVTGLVASIGRSNNAVRTAWFHFAFNVIGSAVFFVVLVFVPVMSFLRQLLIHEAMAISAFQIVFNITCTLMLLPFSDAVIKLTALLAPQKTVHKHRQLNITK